MKLTEEKSRIRIRTKTDPPERCSFCCRRTLLYWKLFDSFVYRFPLPLENSCPHPTVWKCDHKHVRLYVSYISLDEWMWRGEETVVQAMMPRIFLHRSPNIVRRQKRSMDLILILGFHDCISHENKETSCTGRCCIIETVNNIYKGVVAATQRWVRRGHWFSHNFSTVSRSNHSWPYDH